ncbi:Uncharacterised protein [Yersinia bercovieri]|nr:Uncharacterised protein [Yersinia bercovieri]
MDSRDAVTKCLIFLFDEGEFSLGIEEWDIGWLA